MKRAVSKDRSTSFACFSLLFLFVFSALSFSIQPNGESAAAKSALGGPRVDAVTATTSTASIPPQQPFTASSGAMTFTVTGSSQATVLSNSTRKDQFSALADVRYVLLIAVPGTVVTLSAKVTPLSTSKCTLQKATLTTYFDAKQNSSQGTTPLSVTTSNAIIKYDDLMEVNYQDSYIQSGCLNDDISVFFVFAVRPIVTMTADAPSTTVGAQQSVNFSGRIFPMGVGELAALNVYKDGKLVPLSASGSGIGISQRPSATVTPDSGTNYYSYWQPKLAGCGVSANPVVPCAPGTYLFVLSVTITVYDQAKPLNATILGSLPLTAQVSITLNVVASQTGGQSSQLNLYPTQSNFTTFNLDYSAQQPSSPIALSVLKDANFPQGLAVSFKPPNAQGYSASPPVAPSSGGKSSVSVNVTLTCGPGICAQLPFSYPLRVAASSGPYSQNLTISLQLLKAKWVVMEYLAADTTPVLEGPMLYNVEEGINATAGVPTPKVGILALLNLYSAAPGPGSVVEYHSGTATTSSYSVSRPQYSPWGLSSIPVDTTQLYQLVQGSAKKIGPDWTAATDKNFSDSRTLAKFLQTSMALLPADHYQLIISDHGGGIEGLAWDYHEGDKPLSVMALNSALATVPGKLDVLSFDACLMSELEVLATVGAHASYITSSERTIPGYGYAYDAFLTFLSKNPNAAPVDLARDIVQTYTPRYDGSTTVNGAQSLKNATLAAIDTSQLPAVVTAADALSKALAADYKTGGPAFNASVSAAVGASWRADAGRPYTDLADLARNLLSSNGITDATVKTDATSLLNAINRAVVANVVDYNVGGTKAFAGYSGMTILLWDEPRVPSVYTHYYLGLYSTTTFSTATSWSAFVTAFNRSLPANQAGGVNVRLNHQGHQLYLHVYDPTGRHVGVNPALATQSREALDLQIPGAYYADFHNGTVVIALPRNVGNFTAVVDGYEMLEANEAYTVSVIAYSNGTTTSTKTLSNSISMGSLQSTPFQNQNGVLAVGATSTVSLPTLSSHPSSSASNAPSNLPSGGLPLVPSSILAPLSPLLEPISSATGISQGVVFLALVALVLLLLVAAVARSRRKK